MPTVARIGVHIGRMMRVNTVSVPAPSISAASCSDGSGRKTLAASALKYCYSNKLSALGELFIIL